MKIPGSKSISQRALILAAQKSDKTVLKNLCECEDTEVLIDALKQIGVKINKENDEYIIYGGNFHSPSATLDFKNNASGLRFFKALCKKYGLSAKFTGFAEKNRPQDPAKATKTSSQFISAELLVGENIDYSEDQVSMQYIELTKNIIQNFKSSFTIETDLSSLAPLLIWSALSGSKLQIPNLNLDSKQPDLNIVKILISLGSKIEGNTFIPPKLNTELGIIDAKDFPDGAISLMMLAPFLSTPSTFINIGHLKYKESDRLKVIEENLNKLGIKTISTDSSLQIFPIESIPQSDIIIDPKNDHRIAMNFAILRTKIPQIQISKQECVNKSFPSFWQTLPKHIILIGSRGTGKSQLGALLSKKLGLPFIDLDDELEKEHSAISMLTKEKISWPEFRKLEEDLFKKVLSGPQKIIATGGGTAESKRNRELIKMHQCIYLNGDPEIISNWLRERPMQPKYQRSVQEDMQNRHKIYAPIADLEINTTPWEPQTAIEKISLFLAQQQAA